MMACSQNPNEETHQIGGMFAVCPKTDCPHLEPLVSGIANLQIDLSKKCTDCDNIGENWVCLKCSGVFCSRYVNSHMVIHNEQDQRHVIALSFSDLSFWCYGCDSYIQSTLLNGIYMAAATAKFDTPSPPSQFSAKHLAMDISQDEPSKKMSFYERSSLPKDVLLSRIRAVLYGNCIGDAIGLLTEFMTKDQAREIYMGKQSSWFGRKKHKSIDNVKLEYPMKIDDMHRYRFQTGDWTDDSDQMILILRTLLDCNGKADEIDFAHKFRGWVRQGFPELGDMGGMGIGATTNRVVRNPNFLENPHKVAFDVWEASGRFLAPNGGVMRTSILGIHDYHDIDAVINNTRNICKVTHADPRCIASCVAVTTAIALMLQGKHCTGNEHLYDTKKLCNQAFEYACRELDTKEEKKELKFHMFASSLSDLQLDDQQAIGYTYKCLGAGFWVYRQNDFRQAITRLVMEAGDADTNGAVAGALLGCKLGVEKLPESWVSGMLHKKWLDNQIDRYLSMVGAHT